MVKAYHRASCGLLEISAEDGKITAVGFASKKGREAASPVLKQCAREFREYFLGKRKHFSVATEVHGTPFQKKVWKALSEIPYGKTVSYLDLAKKIGKPKAVRAVASAVGANPLCVMNPCHRVIGSDGTLTGYAYGLKKKAALLKLEKVSLPKGLSYNR